MLPTGGDEPWPPRWLDPVNDKIDIWAAWMSGDPEQLAAIYAGNAAGDTTGFFASEAGGFKATARRVVSNIVRWFWGQRTTGRPHRRLHEPIAGDIASASADLLFSEPPVITCDDDQAQALLDQIMDDGAHATLLEAAETASALSGVYLRIRWDSEVAETPWFDAIAPDCAVPEFHMGRLAAVTFWKVIKRNGDTVVRHLERHEPGRIRHGVYAGTDHTIGHLASLADYPETAALAEALTGPDEIATGTDRLTAVYIPNMRPNRIWRSIPQAAPLGVSDYAGIEGLMDALDETYSSLIRDVSLAKARLVVPRQYLMDVGRGKGAVADLDRELYEPINAMADEDKGMQLEMVQFDIRVEDHERVIGLFKRDIVASAGYSAATFGLDDGTVAATATEINARNRRSFTTRARKTRYWRPGLDDILTTVLALSGHENVEVTIEWPDPVSVDAEAEARTLQSLDTARAISTEQKVRRLHPDWDDDDIDDEVDRIKEENQIGAAEDPGTFTGGTFGAVEDTEQPAEEQPEETEAGA